MAVSVYKWLMVSCGWFLFSLVIADNSVIAEHDKYALHPLYISVVEINHNAADNSLEISCKIFTNDFEKTLANNYKLNIDLSTGKDKNTADKLVSDYIKKHLLIKTDGREVNFNYLGFESQEDAIYSYFEVDKLPSVKRLDIINTLLHDFSEHQTNIIHCIVGGKRQSSKLDYPNSTASFKW